MTNIIGLFEWRDLIDISIVSFVLYRILLIVKGTKAGQMLIGLILLLIASAVSEFMPLHTLQWLLQGFWLYIVIALVVIFQPEIRRALAKMGETTFLHAFTTAEEIKSIEEIVRASVSMANRRIGALIVLQRETDLKDFVEIGTPLDAKVSKEILLSIFHPTSPIHDGAAVISGNRIIAAGCFLPIASSPNIAKTFGTRHRAALGLTEETDSIAIVVSEETGVISMALGNSLETHLDMGTLRDKLTDMFTEKKSR